ncbi:exopolysaccharide transport family protein [uncultured Alsobacter sp.]|uniref:GumC family protein n=1 Tax=uncultured Alsobacter sp. TaxID=1748258 RepID=UPI0025FD3A73|nr:exopolysaccharide transport family protein [uncultured Alsobacter sp.]
MAQTGPVLPAPGGEGTGDLDLNQLGVALSRARYWILVPTVLALVVAAVVVNLITPRYTAEARLILQSGDSYFTRPNGSTDPGIGPFDEREMASQVQLASSREIIRAGIDRLKLRGNPEFDKYAAPGLVRSVMMAIGLSKTPTEVERDDYLVEAVRERMLAFSVGLSRVLTIEFSSNDPQLAALGANTFADLFLESQAEAKKQSARAAGAWLINTIDPLRERVAAAEAKVEDFRARKGLLASGTSGTLPQQQLSEMNTQLSAARSAQADAQARAKMIRDALAAGRPLEISDVANNELVRKLTADRSALRAQISLEARTLLPGHPRMKELAAQLATVDSEIRATAEKAVRTFENDARVQGARVDQIGAALDQLKGQSAQANENEVELRALEREARSQRDQLEAMMTRYREAMARDAKDAAPADARIVSRAYPPATPSFPKRLPIVLVATIATLLVGAAVVVTRELLSGRAYVGGARAAAVPLNAPVVPLGAAVDAPLAARDPESEPEEASAEADAPADPPALAGKPAVQDLSLVDALRILAEAADSAGSLGVFGMVASDVSRTGLDSAFALGRTLARRRRTVLVDLISPCDETRPGLGDVVLGQANFLQVLNRDSGSRLHVVAPGAALGDSPDAWEQPLRRSLEALRTAYGCVLVAAPSPAYSRLSQDLARLADAVVLVIDQDAAADTVRAALLPGSPELIVVRSGAAEDAVAAAV